ncbi:MAG: response regulator [Oligoflexia bacterium]|nr:response regulator [Oligoflexia bacterium]
MGRKVLVVDDAAFVREVLRTHLQRLGHEVVGEAANGAEAIAMAQKLKPELIIMDLVMPEKSGIQAIKEILSENRRVRILACSTIDQELMMTRAVEAGAHDFLHKPFKAKDLQERIDSVFSNQSREELI